jgi:hypothetical protein
VWTLEKKWRGAGVRNASCSNIVRRHEGRSHLGGQVVGKTLKMRRKVNKPQGGQATTGLSANKSLSC